MSYRPDDADGRTAHALYMRQWRLDNRDKVRAIRQRCDAKHPHLKTSRNNRYHKEHPEIRAAHKAVFSAVKRGTLIRPSFCQLCLIGSRRIQGHHPDYSNPLDVVWLCQTCHQGIHGRAYGQTIVEVYA